MNYLAHRVSRDLIPGSTIHLILKNARDVGFTLDPKLPLSNKLTVNEKKSPTPSLSGAEFTPTYKACIAALSDYAFAIDGRMPTTYDDADLLCSCIINCSTLEEVIHRAITFARALNGRYGTLSLEVGDKEVVFTMDTDRKSHTMPGLICDFLGLCFYYKLFSWLIAEPLQEASIGLAYPQPADKKAFSDMVSFPIAFDASNNTMTFSKAMLRKPLVKTYKELVDVLKVAPFELLPPPPVTQVSTILVGIFKRLLEEKIQIPTVDQIAHKLGQSGPTLRRRLANENTSFQVLIDKCRTDKAIELLTQTDLTIDEISFNLGFSAPSGFSRAFKDWTGVAPSVYRQTLRQPE